MQDVPINRIMTTNPATVSSGDPVSTAKKLLDSGDIHHLPVVDNEKLVGIVSSSDLLKLYLLDDPGPDTPFADVSVAQIMEPDPVVLEIGTNLRDAANVLAIGGYHAAPVIEPDRTLVGIVTTADLATHLLEMLPRGDGSIRLETSSEPEMNPGKDDVSSVLRAAEKAAENGDVQGAIARALLLYRERNRLLHSACQAAELYMRSGHAEHEHSVLLKRLAAVQDSKHEVMI